MTRGPAPPLPDWLARMMPAERYAVRVGRIEVHVVEAGDPRGKPVLLLHGNPTWSFLWRKVAASLAGAPLRLVMPDLPGLGLSTKVPSRWHSLDAHIDTMAGLLDELRLDHLVFAGQDWGGPIGLGALARRPGRATGLVLANTVAGPPRPGFRPTAFHRFARLPVVSELVFRGLGFPQVKLGLVQGDRRSISGDVSRAYRWPLRGLGRNGAPLALARLVPDGPDHPSIAALERCHAFVQAFPGPVELVWGLRDPILGRVLSHLERLLPQARVTRTQAGHFLQEEVPDELAAAIRRVAGV